MTPKQKAEKLVDNYLTASFGVMEEYIPVPMVLAKQCALIAVNELITAHNKMKDFLFDEIGYLITTPDYWQEVKQEIEKL